MRISITPWLIIKELYVSDNYRGCGAGKALFTAAVDLCQRAGGKKIKWEVLTDNHKALQFYQQRGGKTEQQWMLMSLSL